MMEVKSIGKSIMLFSQLDVYATENEIIVILSFEFVIFIPLKGNNSTHSLSYCDLLTISVIYMLFAKNNLN
jgi:hypothetical protein